MARISPNDIELMRELRGGPRKAGKITSLPPRSRTYSAKKLEALGMIRRINATYHLQSPAYKYLEPRRASEEASGVWPLPYVIGYVILCFIVGLIGGRLGVML